MENRSKDETSAGSRRTAHAKVERDGPPVRRKSKIVLVVVIGCLVLAAARHVVLAAYAQPRLHGRRAGGWPHRLHRRRDSGSVVEVW